MPSARPSSGRASPLCSRPSLASACTSARSGVASTYALSELLLSIAAMNARASSVAENRFPRNPSRACANVSLVRSLTRLAHCRCYRPSCLSRVRRSWGRSLRRGNTVTAKCGARSGGEGLGIEHRIFGIRIVQNCPAAAEARALIDPPGRGMAMTSLEHETGKPFPASQCLDRIEHAPTDTTALMGGTRVHALDFGRAFRVASQRAAGHCSPVLAGNEQGGMSLGHLLGGHVETELRWR